MAQLTWRRVAASPAIQRSSQTIAAVDGELFIYGGELTPREPVDSDVYMIDLKSDSSSILRANKDNAETISPIPRVGTASTALDGKIYLFSGRGGTAMAPIEEQGALWVFDCKSKTWSQLHPAEAQSYPAGRSYHAMTNDGKDTIFLHAGCPEKGRLSDLWSFSVPKRQWTEFAAAPEPARGGTSIAFSDGRLYRMNGFDGKTEQGGVFDVYEPTVDRWSSIAFSADGVTGPGPRSVSCLLPVNIDSEAHLVTMFGEQDPSSLGHQGAGKMLGDVWAYDIQGQKWKQLKSSNTQAPAPRGWFGADVLHHGTGSQSVVVHGGLAESNERLDDVWLFDI